MSDLPSLPKIGLTMGDVAGIGPEVIARAVLSDEAQKECQPIVFGHPAILEEALELVSKDSQTKLPTISVLKKLDETKQIQPDENRVLCFNPGADDVASISRCQFDARAGQAAYDYLISAIRAAQAGLIDGISTAPLAKASLHQAGIFYPGHTEILAEECGVNEFAMMLYVPPGDLVKAPSGLAVSHVTLHTSVKSVPELLTTESVLSKIELTYKFMQSQGLVTPRIGVCALNPHGGEQGLFGNEEETVILPAVQAAQRTLGETVSGPFPTDTLMKRAIVEGEFDGVVAIYHDQGHIAIKLVAFDTAVNVTLGLPIVRTSPSHGTAFDIAWQGKAQGDGMITAIQVAARLARQSG